MIKLTTILACALALSCTLSAVAQPYPSKPLRLIVPFPPGGTADALCREIAARMSAGFGQQVLVDNRGGANGTEMDKNGRLIRELGLKAD